MFKLDSEQALVASFRPRDRGALELPPGVRFPLFVRDYLSWTDPSGFRVFLIFATPKGAPTGIAFTRGAGSDPSVGHICGWCHTAGGGNQIGLLTTDLNSKKRIGVHACLDLSCKAKVEDAANRGGRSALDAVKELVERMGRFASEGLGIDLTGLQR